MSLGKNEKLRGPSMGNIDGSQTFKFCKMKVSSFMDMITNTLLSIQRYKSLDIVSASDLNMCVEGLEILYIQLRAMSDSLEDDMDTNCDDIITMLQKINNDISDIFRRTGTLNIYDVVTVVMGNDFLRIMLEGDSSGVFEVIKTYIHPISYVVLPWRGDDRQNIDCIDKLRNGGDLEIVKSSKNFDCFDLGRTCNRFYKKVYGVKVALHNTVERKTLIISGITDDILLGCTNDEFIQNKLASLREYVPNNIIGADIGTDIMYDNETECKDNSYLNFEKYCDILTMKDILIYSNHELYLRYRGQVTQLRLLKRMSISQIVNKFITADTFGQRRIIIQLLLNNELQFQYTAYLLYDLLSNYSNGVVDTDTQTIIFDSLPWNIKKNFREAMRTTINYTKTLSNFDISKVPIEQQICLLKAPDRVKEKAMVKLKEVQAKSDDTGSKARQYLEGLLKIPFGIFKKEPALNVMSEIKERFDNITATIRKTNIKIPIPDTTNSSSFEISRYFPRIKDDAIAYIKNKDVDEIISILCTGKRSFLVSNVCFINELIKTNNINIPKIYHSGKKGSYIKTAIRNFVHKFKDNNTIIQSIKDKYPNTFNDKSLQILSNDIKSIEDKRKVINDTLSTIDDKLDSAAYGHTSAKRQLKRIIGQWINGEQNGYCFGFEGPPGVGKTSLAKKGLSQCLEDEEGVCRPFAFIPIGGSSNGSTLSGHNYTYVGSTWGRVVDILMDAKCMNPIIFIDELDKVSRSENGKEIIGILTHLIDGTQSESFQDKYFSGIDLDLSKALFIFSYNDPSMIDKILLDRIHRVKFDNLTIEDKIVIVREYILPEIYKKVGLQGCVCLSDDVITFIIETYTYESGVRKLKEIMFEIVSEINLELLQNYSYKELPITVTKDDIITNYLKERIEITFTEIHKNPATGIVTGLWANSLGKGGIIPIECIFYPSNNLLDLKLTGSQGDVMKESCNVAKSIAWNLTKPTQQKKLLKRFNDTKLQGIQLHCPEGATPKDGPSAGTAMTIAMYSLFNNKKVRNDIAITGEINLQGCVTAIGGLNLKILGGIKAGVKMFIFPKSNEKDFDKFMEIYKGKDILAGVTFKLVENIADVITLAFV
jgi:ATP-dependent Lon protease